MRTLIIVPAAWLLALSACPSGSPVSPPPPAPPALHPLYEECVSWTPVDPGNPNQPVIALRGSAVVHHPRGTPYSDAGASASDPHDGDISGRVAVTGLDAIDTGVVRDYMLRYNVSNAAGLPAAEAVRIVRITDGRFAAQTARDIGSTAAHMGYYEHLPVHYGDDPDARFPLILYQHGAGGARFSDDGTTAKTPLAGLEQGDMVKLIKDGLWDDSRPFIVLSPQRCIDPILTTTTANRTRVFLEYALHTYKVDTSRIYFAGYSAGSSLTWDYANNFPHQLAAIVPMSGGWGTASGCTLKETPSWAFQAFDDPLGAAGQIQTVASINNCNPVERARLTVFPTGGHNVVEEFMTIALTGLGQGMPQWDIYDRSIYDWLLEHRRALSVAPERLEPGGHATLSWSFPGAASCVASGDWTGPRPASGAERVRPAAPGVYNYLLTCAGMPGTVSGSVSLSVERPRPQPVPDERQ